MLQGAIAIADTAGIGALTIRSLAQAGRQAHGDLLPRRQQDEILDGIVDLVFAEIELPEAGGDWRSKLVRRANSAPGAGRHWAIGLMESRKSPGPATLPTPRRGPRHPPEAGFSVEMTAHAYALLDSYVYGFALQGRSALQGPRHRGRVAEPMMQQFPADAYPTSSRWQPSSSCNPATTSAMSSSSDST